MASISSLSKMEMSLEDVIKMSKQTKEVKKDAPAKKAAPAAGGKKANKANTEKKGKKPATPAKGAKKGQGGKPVAIAAFKGKGAKGTPVKKGKGIMQGAMKNNKQAIVKAVTAKASAGRQAKLAQKRGLGANVQAAAKKRAQQVVVPTNLRNQNGRAQAAQGRKTPQGRAVSAQSRQPQKPVTKKPISLPKAPVPKNNMVQIHITNNNAKKGKQPAAKPMQNMGGRGANRNNRAPNMNAVTKQPKKQIVKPLGGGIKKGLGRGVGGAQQGKQAGGRNQAGGRANAPKGGRGAAVMGVRGGIQKGGAAQKPGTLSARFAQLRRN